MSGSSYNAGGHSTVHRKKTISEFITWVVVHIQLLVKEHKRKTIPVIVTFQ